MTAAAQDTVNELFRFMHLELCLINYTKGNAADWVSLADPNAATGSTNIPGAIPGTVNACIYTGAADPITTFGTATVAANSTNGTAAGSATGTILNLSSVVPATRSSSGVPFAIMTSSGEIMLATTDSAPTSGTTTCTVIRGAYGTTGSATGMTGGSSTVYILNAVVLSAGTGVGMLSFIPLPADPNVKIFSTIE